MQNDKIKEYWEGEAGIYSEGIKAVCAGKRTSGSTGCRLRAGIF